MPSYSMNHIIHSDETEVPGMKILYADKSEPGCVTYINDVVYDVRSGVPLHLQMLYPDVPAALMEKREAEQQAEQVAAQTDTEQDNESKFGGSNPYQPTLSRLRSAS